jgi:hypothetical protein
VPDRGGDQRRQGPPHRPQGERDHRQADPRGTGAEARRLQAEKAAQLSPAEEEQIREEAAARAFLSGDPDADHDGDVETDEAEAAAEAEGDTIAELMGAGDNPEIAAVVEEAAFDELTEEEQERLAEEAAAKK